MNRRMAPCRVTRYTIALNISTVTISKYNTPSSTNRSVMFGLCTKSVSTILTMYTT